VTDARSPLRVSVARVDGAGDLPLPGYATAGAAGMDLLAAVERELWIESGARAAVPTGLRIAVPAGYEAQINSSFADPQKTGSLYALAPVKTHLVPPDTWFDYHLTCREEAGGTRIVIRVNGVVVTDFLDTERRHARGHVALQQHHEGSVLEVRALEVRELD